MDSVYIVCFVDWNDETDIIRVYSDYDSAMSYLESLKFCGKYEYGRLYVDTCKVWK